jgi:phage shock protein A
MGFFGKLWAVLRGVFIKAGDDVVSSSPQAIRATYAAAIDDAKRRYRDMENAVALLAAQRDKTELSFKSLEAEEADLQRKLEGALAHAEADPTNPDHREAGSRFLSQIQRIQEKQTLLKADLESSQAKVQEYQSKLRSFMEEIDKLKREQGEMVAEWVSSQQMVQLEDRLRGLGETAVDESLVAIRDKVASMKARAKLASEMRGATLAVQDETYERIGAEREAAARFDELLKARSAPKAGTKEKERDLG